MMGHEGVRFYYKLYIYDTRLQGRAYLLAIDMQSRRWSEPLYKEGCGVVEGHPIVAKDTRPDTRHGNQTSCPPHPLGFRDGKFVSIYLKFYFQIV
jgi:hypothetical protein